MSSSLLDDIGPDTTMGELVDAMRDANTGLFVFTGVQADGTRIALAMGIGLCADPVAAAARGAGTEMVEQYPGRARVVRTEGR